MNLGRSAFQGSGLSLLIHEFDAVVVGAGIAGLSAALEASKRCNVADFLV
jgi:succinate dehydrogenase/fumarate reductase flavoprotein subunit